jgi:hypothetical protein
MRKPKEYVIERNNKINIIQVTDVNDTNYLPFTLFEKYTKKMQECPESYPDSSEDERNKLNSYNIHEGCTIKMKRFNKPLVVKNFPWKPYHETNGLWYSIGTAWYDRDISDERIRDGMPNYPWTLMYITFNNDFKLLRIVPEHRYDELSKKNTNLNTIIVSYKMFKNIYMVPTGKLYDTHNVNYVKIIIDEKFDGIEFPDFNYFRHSEEDECYRWMCAIDVPSGCIFDTSKITVYVKSV